MTALLAAALAATGVGLLVLPPPARRRRLPALSGVHRSAAEWLVQAGVDDVGVGPFIGVVALAAGTSAVVAWTLFGGVIGPVGVALAAGGGLAGSYRSRRLRRVEQARQAWPRIIEDVRLHTGGLGRSVPQALLGAGRRAPAEMHAAFRAAEREWSVSTDFGRALAALQTRLADPAADAVCETLLVAHELGGADLDRRLAALAEDRIIELQGRKDALARQAGARFARRFVLLVPLGMALTGLSIGNGRAAYETPAGQVAVGAALAAVVGCWVWAGRLMRLPDTQRVFRPEETPR